MKAFTIFLTAFFLITGSAVRSQENQIIDDVYFKPSDAKKISVQNTTEKRKPNYKNGAKEIIYIEKVVRDTVYVDSESTDSAEYDEQGEYLHGFNGSQSDYEYAERIRKFHNPKYTVFIGDPDYNSIFFLNSNDWNVYIEDSYAWVTPTWTNPYWFNYYWQPYSYNSMYWRNWWGPSYYNYYSPWSSFGMYGSWYGNYWDYGWGYPYYGMGYGMGYGYPYYGGYYGSYYGGYYGGYYDGWGYYGGGTIRERNTAHSESARRDNNLTNSGRIGSQASNAAGRSSSVSGGSYNSPRSTYTAVSGESYRTSGIPTNGSARRVRSGSSENLISRGSNSGTVSGRSSNYNSSNVTITRPSAGRISTTPRTTTSVTGARTNETNRSTYTTQSGSRSTYSTGRSPSAVRSSTTTAPSSTRSSSSYSTPSYSAPSSSSSSSSGSYSSGSSSSSSSRGSSGGSSSGGRR